jgi:molybdopterin/thiamine biosynthesis adenylyltransferase
LNPLDAFLFSGADRGLLPWAVQQQAADRFHLSLRQVEQRALELDLLPLRYRRNPDGGSVWQQLRLFRSRVAVVGCGGLGGYVVEQLCRLGVGTVAVFDPDVFEESNLNRQLLSSVATLGAAKVEAARERAERINPAVELVAVKTAVSRANGTGLLRGYQVVVDALDSIPARLELGEICGEIGSPLVHGSIGGWYGQVTVQLPGRDNLRRIYGVNHGERGAEEKLGTPSFTPAVVAGIETAEVTRLLLGAEAPLRDRVLHIDLSTMKVVRAKP